MEIFRNSRKKMRDRVALLLPVLVPVILAGAFWNAVDSVSEDTMAKEQVTLTRALEKGAVRTYALTGKYPQSLEELTEDYHITYDKERFVVEYVSDGANMLPMIQVIPLKKGGTP